MIFFATEITAYKPGAATYTYSYGWGAEPWGTFADYPDLVASTVVILASDTGYRTAPTDANGPAAYPPLVAEAFAISRSVNLDPTTSTIAAAWGSIALSNPDNNFDAIAAAWNNDGRPAKVLYGTKALENFDGLASGRTTTGTYIDHTGTMQTAAVRVLRADYTPGSAVILNEPMAANAISNSQGAVYGSQPRFTSAVSADLPALLTGANIRKVTDVTGSGDNNAMGDVSFAVAAGVDYAASLWVWIPSAFAGTSIGFALPGAAGPVTVNNADMTKRNQWQRISLADVWASATTSGFVLRPATMLGDYFYWTCPQFEQGAAPTSYIPTTTGPATRSADANYSARGVFLDPAYTTLIPAFVGVSTPWFLTDTQLQIPLRDATYWIEQPLQSVQYLGTGTYEGTASLTGTPKPKTRGAAFNETPVLIDPANQIYQYSDAPGTVVTLYEGGAANHTFQADTTDLYSGTTSTGYYRTDDSRGLFQLGSSPVANITADVTGAFATAGNKTVAADIAYYLLTEDLATPAANVNAASFTAAAAAYPYAAGVYFSPSNTLTGVDALDRVLAGFGAKLYPARDGTLRVLALRVPAGSPVATFSPVNTVSVVPSALPSTLSPPTYRIRVAYQTNNTVQTSGLIGAATPAQVQYVAAVARYAAASSTAILSTYARPNDLAPVGGSLVNQADAQAVATALSALWGARRRLYDVTVPVSLGIAREIGDVVEIVWPIDDLPGGQIGVIVGDAFKSGDATITLTVLI